MQTGMYYVGFWVKNAGSTPANGSYDASITLLRTVTSGLAPCTNAALSSNPNAQTLGVNTSMLFTGSATCPGTANYSWWVGRDQGGGNVSWQQVTQFQAGNTYNWTPTQAGTYYVGFWVKNAGSTPANGSYDASITLIRTVTGPTQLTSGVSLPGQSVALDETKFYFINVPAGAGMLQVTISGSGDADLYTRFGAPPDFATWSCRPFINGSNETCQHASPAAGSWWVMIHGYEPANFTIVATVS